MQPHFALSLVTPPATEPLALADVKPWLRVDADDTTQDAVLTRLIIDARRRCERVTGRALVTQAWLYGLDRFPGYDPGAAAPSPAYDPASIGWGYLRVGLDADPRAMRLPRPPLQSVVSVTYVDTLGATQCLLNSIPAAVTVTGSQAVTPAVMGSMSGSLNFTAALAAGSTLTVDAGAKQETVTVTGVTATTFTAVFANTHAAGVNFWGSGYGGGGPLNVDALSEPARILPAYGQTYPIARVALQSVATTYLAGYAAVPEDVLQRMLAYVAHCYEHREDQDEDWLGGLFDSLVVGNFW